MPVITGPGPLMAAFLIREANGMYRSREEANVDGGEAGLEPGTLLASPTAGNYVRATTGADVAGILLEGIAAYSGETAYAPGANIQRRTVVVRDAEVHKTELVYPSAVAGVVTAADVALRGLGLIPRL